MPEGLKALNHDGLPAKNQQPRNLLPTDMKHLLLAALVVGSISVAAVCGTGCDSGDSSDTNPPEVAITAPNDGQWLDGSTSFDIEATATDESGIAVVSFTIDGELIGEDRALPFETNWDPSPKADNMLHLVTVTATDTDDNQGSAQVSIGLNTLADTWVVISVEDDDGDQTAAFRGNYSDVRFSFSESGTFTVTFEASGGGNDLIVNGVYTFSPGGVQSPLSIDFTTPNGTVPWSASYSWENALIIVEGPVKDFNLALGTALVGSLKMTMEVVPPLESQSLF